MTSPSVSYSKVGAFLSQTSQTIGPTNGTFRLVIFPTSSIWTTVGGNLTGSLGEVAWPVEMPWRTNASISLALATRALCSLTAFSDSFSEKTHYFILFKVATKSSCRRHRNDCLWTMLVYKTRHWAHNKMQIHAGHSIPFNMFLSAPCDLVTLAFDLSTSKPNHHL